MEAPQMTIRMSGREKVLLYCVSFLIPILGVAISFHYYYKTDQEFKHLGSVCATLMLLGFLFWLILGDSILRFIGSLFGY